MRGIDLAHALNYVAVEDAGIAFCYDAYTATRLAYRPGDRPVLESLARSITRSAANDLDAAERVMQWVAEQVRWAGHYRRDHGERLPTDRCLVEEDLIDSGFGWCNEQARVLCCLTQAVGIPSRIVFACDTRERFGHCVTEARVGDGWVTLDQSLEFVFLDDGRGIRAVDIWGDKPMREHFTPRYRERCADMIAALGRDAVAEDFAMAAAANPLEGFARIGFHNHYLL